MPRAHRCLASCALLVLALAFRAEAQGFGTAPDGRPGFGTEGSAREYGALWRSPSPAETAFLDSLLGLPGELAIRREAIAAEYRAEGMFAIVPELPRARLTDVHARFLELEADPLAVMRDGGERARAFARAFLDARFRLRLETDLAIEEETRELRGGLALLRATQDGFVEMQDLEARSIARRVDIAASMLRAARLDLDLLGSSLALGAPGAPDPAWIPLLEEIASYSDPEARPQALHDLAARVERTRLRMLASLFRPRLEEQIGPELAQRAAGRDRARALAREVRVFVPDTAEGADAPPEVAQLRKHERYGFALRYALDGMALDPFHDELCYWAGVATDFVHDRRLARAWLDRFLTLRGIRAHRPETFARELDPMESYALELVQSVPPLPR